MEHPEAYCGILLEHFHSKLPSPRLHRSNLYTHRTTMIVHFVGLWSTTRPRQLLRAEHSRITTGALRGVLYYGGSANVQMRVCPCWCCEYLSQRRRELSPPTSHIIIILYKYNLYVSLSLYIYIYIYVYTYMHIYSIHVCIHICICMYICMCVYVYIHAYTTLTHTCFFRAVGSSNRRRLTRGSDSSRRWRNRQRPYTYLYISLSLYIYTYIYIYIYIYIHTLRRGSATHASIAAGPRNTTTTTNHTNNNNTNKTKHNNTYLYYTMIPTHSLRILWGTLRMMRVATDSGSTVAAPAPPSEGYYYQMLISLPLISIQLCVYIYIYNIHACIIHSYSYSL